MPNDDPAVEERFAVEVEVALEMGAAEEEREPITVVGPHFVVGNLVERVQSGTASGVSWGWPWKSWATKTAQWRL